LAERFGHRRIEFRDRQRLRLDFALRASLRAPIKKLLDLVPTGDQEEQAGNPGSELNRMRRHGSVRFLVEASRRCWWCDNQPIGQQGTK